MNGTLPIVIPAKAGIHAKQIVIPQRPWRTTRIPSSFRRKPESTRFRRRPESMRNSSSFLGARGEPPESHRHSGDPNPIVIPAKAGHAKFVTPVGNQTHHHSSAPVGNHPNPIVIPAKAGIHAKQFVIPRRPWGTTRIPSSFRRRPESMPPPTMRKHDCPPALAGITNSNVGTTHKMGSMKKHA